MILTTLLMTFAAFWTVPSVGQAQTGRTQNTEPAHKTLALTGCLHKTANESAFRLTDATRISRTSPAQVSPTGTSDTSAEPTEYELKAVTSIGENGVRREELQRHVGQKVEVAARPYEETPPAPASPKVLDESQSNPREQPKLLLTVTAIKSISPTCS